MGKGFKLKFRISDKINDFNLEVMESVKGGVKQSVTLV
jgi:hypothetical protein